MFKPWKSIIMCEARRKSESGCPFTHNKWASTRGRKARASGLGQLSPSSNRTRGQWDLCIQGTVIIRLLGRCASPFQIRSCPTGWDYTFRGREPARRALGSPSAITHINHGAATALIFQWTAFNPSSHSGSSVGVNSTTVVSDPGQVKKNIWNAVHVLLINLSDTRQFSFFLRVTFRITTP